MIKIISKSIQCSCLALTLSIVACSTPAPHLGDTVTEAKLGDGVDLTNTENRRLQANGKIAGENSSILEITAKVTDINRAKRTLTVSSPEGELTTIKIGEEVRNFKQIAKGDNVDIKYLVSIAFETRKPTQEELLANGNSLSVAARAQLGEKPGMGVAAGSVNVVTVTSIDKKAGFISVKDSQGGLLTVKAKYPSNLSYVQVGDSIVVTTTEAIAASVSKLP